MWYLSSATEFWLVTNVNRIFVGASIGFYVEFGEGFSLLIMYLLTIFEKFQWLEYFGWNWFDNTIEIGFMKITNFPFEFYDRFENVKIYFLRSAKKNRNAHF